jgi:hypothetical protein
LKRLSTRTPAESCRGDATPGIAGNAIEAAGTSVPSSSRGCRLGGGAAPSFTHLCIASSSARIVHQ